MQQQPGITLKTLACGVLAAPAVVCAIVACSGGAGAYEAQQGLVLRNVTVASKRDGSSACTRSFANWPRPACPR